VVWAAGVRMAVREQQGPAVLGGLLCQGVDGLGAFHVEGEVVEAGSAAVVVRGGEVWGLFDDDVGRVQPPAATGRASSGTRPMDLARDE